MGNENNSSCDFILEKNKGCCNKQSLYISSGKVDPSEITCCICFTIFNSPRVMKCKHVFCEQCIGTWGKSSTVTCPYCRIELKRHRGSFGRVDKKTQKKIDKISLKCRNCCWQGSYCMYVTNFSIQPYLDEQQGPSYNERGIQDRESCNNVANLEKRQNLQVEITSGKQQGSNQASDKLGQQKQTDKVLGLFINTLLQFGINEGLGGNSQERNLFQSPNQSS